MRFSFEIFEMHHLISYTNPRNESEKSLFCEQHKNTLTMNMVWTKQPPISHTYSLEIRKIFIP